MNTPEKNRLFIVAVPILLVITMVLVASVQAGSNSCTATLTTSQYVDVGVVTVWHDETALYVEYNTINAQELDIPDGWEIAETRLAIVLNLLYAPVNSRETDFIYREGGLCGGYYPRERNFL